MVKEGFCKGCVELRRKSWQGASESEGLGEFGDLVWVEDGWMDDII